MPIARFLSIEWFTCQLEQVLWIVWPSTLWEAIATFFHPKFIVLTAFGLAMIYAINVTKSSYQQARRWIFKKICNFLTISFGPKSRALIAHVCVHFFNRLCLMLSLNLIISVGLNSVEVVVPLDDWTTFAMFVGLVVFFAVSWFPVVFFLHHQHDLC